MMQLFIHKQYSYWQNYLKILLNKKVLSKYSDDLKLLHTLEIF